MPEGAQAELKIVAVADVMQVKPVVEKFRGKYGTSGVNLYSKLDVAVIGQRSDGHLAAARMRATVQ